MNLYQMSAKEFRREMKAFYKTYYGKVVFCLAYAMFFISLIFFLMICINTLTHSSWSYWRYVMMIPVSALFTILCFIIGSIYYYIELKAFICSKKRKVYRNFIYILF